MAVLTVCAAFTILVAPAALVRPDRGGRLVLRSRTPLAYLHLCHVEGRQPPRIAVRQVLFIAGYAENAVIGNSHLEPGMHVLSKPFAMEMLASRIKAIIARG